MLRLKMALASLFALGLAVPAHAQDPAAAPAMAAQARGDPQDPWEKTNRVLFLVGGALDVVVIRPVAVFYQHAAPRPAREGVHNVIFNLGEPLNFVNHVLQLRPGPAGTTVGRFAINSTAGLAGVFDVATAAGFPERGTSFGQTLGRYGVKSGPYVFLPILGPSSVRDTTGRVVDIFLDPFTWVSFRDDGYFFASKTVLTGLGARVRADPQLKYIQQTATDPYAAIRSAYLQNSEFLVNGSKTDLKTLPDFGPEPAAPPAASTAVTPQ